MRAAAVVMGSLAGVAATLALYVIPLAQPLAPLAGGFVAGYLAGAGAWGGAACGPVMAAVMVAPALLLSGLAARALEGVALLEALVRGAGYLVALVVVVHVGALGTLGGALGGWAREQERLGEEERSRALARASRSCPRCGGPMAAGDARCPYCDSSDGGSAQ